MTNHPRILIHVQCQMLEWVQTVQTFKVDLAYNVKASSVFFQSWRVENWEFDRVQNIQTFKVKIIGVFFFSGLIHFLFLEWCDIRDDIIIKTDVTQAILMLILSKSPSHVKKRA